MKDNFDFRIVDKNGKIVENVSFKDYDQLADYMLNVADQWYEGLRSPSDSYNITRTDNDGNVLYSETNSFGEAGNVGEVSDDGAENINLDQ